MVLDLVARISKTVAESRHVGETLSAIVDGLVNEMGFALARIWLLDSTEKCSNCPDQLGCQSREHCLHLRASAGRSIRNGTAAWDRLDGRFSRFPVGHRKIGKVAQTGEAVVIPNVYEEGDWIADIAWADTEGIVSFAGQPLVFQGKVMGVLGVFSRRALPGDELERLRIFADHAAVSLSNARAFEELQSLRAKLELENSYLQEEVREALSFREIVGSSGALQRILTQVELVAPTDATVLILGESGTGKELVARAIHDRSQRNLRPLVKVNCATVPRELFESEFFGHVKGSFTSAQKDRVGRFQLAHQGTLFLDEVGEIPLELQSKLLRVLQEGEFERVGDDNTRHVDVRIIAATNRDLGKEAERRSFREDLYYRLSVFPVVVPPLRQRKEDIPQLASHFIRQSCRRMNLPEPRLTEQHVKLLIAYDWPGNIRELQHVLERAVILGKGQKLVIDLHGIPSFSSSAFSSSAAPELPSRSVQPRDGQIENDGEAPAKPQVGERVLTASQLKELEKQNYMAALRQTGGRIYGSDGAAAMLGIPATTLASRLKAHGISDASNA